MGLFSFKTADKGESIANIFAKDHPNANKTVYMLEPKGEKPISESSYIGNGYFGGVECFEWVARRNLSAQRKRDKLAW